MDQFPFQGFYDKAIGVQLNKNMIEPNMSSNVSNAFKLTTPSILNNDEHQIAILVKNNIDEISDDILSGTIPYIHLFSNHKFIDGFIRGISSIPISYKVRLACNKLTYDYFTSDENNFELKKKYLHISRVVNKLEISQLMSIGLDENTASNLVLCRYSSSNERTNIKRLNFTMYYRDPNVMTEQMVVWIYEKLFDKVSQLFYAVMFEVYSPQEEEDFGDNFMEVYGVVSNAVLDILNNMTSEDIKKVLIGYSEEYEFRSHPRVRFSLRSLSGDYSRISRVVDQLLSSNRYIP